MADDRASDGATKQALLTALGFVRGRVLGQAEALSAEHLLAAPLPSGWTPAGLLLHLAQDVERFWFVQVVGGSLATEGVPPVDGFHLDPTDAVARYRAACAEADAVIAATALDAAPACWPVEVFGEFRLDDLRAVLLHVITETASHAGHLDAARELLDGGQWLVLD